MKELSEAQQLAAIKHMKESKPKLVKGMTKLYDYHKCGACGATLQIVDHYCFKCGTRILWSNPKYLTGVDDEVNITK